MAIVSDQSEHTRHASLGLVLPHEFWLQNWIAFFLLQLPFVQDAYKMPAITRAVDHVKSQTTSGSEIQYKWQDKDNYFGTYALLINNTFFYNLHLV